MKAKKRKLKPQVAKAVRSEVKRELRKAIEAKHQFGTLPQAAVEWGGFVGDLTPMAQGVTDNQRIGDEVRVSSIQLRGVVYNDGNGVTVDAENTVRLIVFQWHLDSQTQAPGVSGILRPTDLLTVAAPFAPWNETNRHQFRVLVDRQFTLSKNGPNAQGFRYNLTKPTRTIKYNDGATHGEDKIYYALVSDSGADTHPHVTMTWAVNYRDA